MSYDRPYARWNVAAAFWDHLSGGGADGLRRRTRRWFAILLVAAAACSSAVSPDDANEIRGVRFEIAQSEYAPGDFAQYRLVNDSDEAYTYNFCFAVLYRLEGSQWVLAGTPRPCAAVGFELAAGQTVAGGEALPSTLPSGSYRFMMAATGGNITCPSGGCPSESLHTGTFRIDPRPAA